MPLDENYLQHGYFDAGNNMYDSLLLEDAKRVAETLVRARMTTHQLRLFFNNCKSISRLLDDQDFESIKHNIYKLPSMAANGKGRGNLPQAFVEFIEKNINLISSEKDFRAFMEHFQAVVGYSRGLTNK